MPAATRLRYLHLAYLSKPRADRVVYRAIGRQRPKRIVEIGLGDGRRAARMIALAQWTSPGEAIQYTAIDLFEGRTGSVPLSLKAVYRKLKATGGQVRLEPGDPHSALARAANTLIGTDLLVLSADLSADSLGRAWFYVPRMLHPGSIVMQEQPGETGPAFCVLPRLEVERLARAAHASRRAA